MDFGKGVKAVLIGTPNEIQDELLQLGENMGASRWRIGDLALLLVEMVKQTKLKDASGNLVGAAHVYFAVSIMVKGEIKPRTVEYYASLADFYPPTLRSDYEPLPFSVFYYARTFGDKWRDVLDFAMEYVEEHGTIPTVGHLAKQFEAINEPPEPVLPPLSPVYYDPAAKFDGEYTSMPVETPVSGATAENGGLHGVVLQNAYQAVWRVASSLPAEKRERIRHLLDALFAELGLVVRA